MKGWQSKGESWEYNAKITNKMSSERYNKIEGDILKIIENESITENDYLNSKLAFQ